VGAKKLAVAAASRERRGIVSIDFLLGRYFPAQPFS
jgi:hypothetical protein